MRRTARIRELSGPPQYLTYFGAPTCRMTAPPTRALSGTLRFGITIIELLCVVGLVSVLLSLVIPAVFAANRAARRVDCAARMKNLGIAVHSHTESRRSLPPSRVEGHAAYGHFAPRTNWVISILPWLELAAVENQIDKALPLNAPANLAVVMTPISALRCPEDITTTGQNDLSFAVNGGLAETHYREGNKNRYMQDALGGIIDLDGDGVFDYRETNTRKIEENRKLGRALGLFVHSRYFPDGTSLVWRYYFRSRPLAGIEDGLSNTMMIAENCRTGVDTEKTFSGWASTDPGNVYVALNPRICDLKSCTKENVDISKANSAPWRINEGENYIEGEAPWPNGFHESGVNIVLADGSVRFLSEDTASEVLFDLFTSNSNDLKNTPFRR